MKIFLIGKNGQVGRELDIRAKKFGYDCVSYTKDELDITDSEKIIKKIEKEKPGFVINASAYHVVPDCEAYPEKAFLINSVAVNKLAAICESKNIGLVHFSTDYVFDGLKGSPYGELDKPNPLQMYGISKLAGEYGVLNYCKKRIIIRASYVYGGKKGSRAKKGNFVLNILNQAKEKKELEASSEMIVSPTYAVDLAEATIKLIGTKKAKGIYHLPNDGYCSLAEFSTHIIKYSNLKSKIIPVERGEKNITLHRPLFSALENTRAKKLNIVLPNWKKSLRKYIEEI
jgi:dTDP-4-dehydrorhamnose reductase